jgi:hypothetical protein
MRQIDCMRRAGCAGWQRLSARPDAKSTRRPRLTELEALAYQPAVKQRAESPRSAAFMSQGMITELVGGDVSVRGAPSQKTQRQTLAISKTAQTSGEKPSESFLRRMEMTWPR